MRFLAVLVAFLVSTATAGATTLAWDGITLACDSQSTGSHTKFLSVSPKIVRSEKRHAVMGAAGDVAFTAPLKKFFMNSDKPLEDYVPSAAAKAHAEEWGFVVIYDDGTALFYNHGMEDPTPVGAPFAMGAGEDFALAAMKCGKNAKEAIEIAEQLDIFTGGPVRTILAPQHSVKSENLIYSSPTKLAL